MPNSLPKQTRKYRRSTEERVKSLGTPVKLCKLGRIVVDFTPGAL